MNTFGQPIKTTFPTSMAMAMSVQAKPHVFENYHNVMSQFQTINTFTSFIQCGQIQPNELLSISNIITESIVKMSEISEFFVRKVNDINVSTSLCDRLQRMSLIHQEALSLIYKFSEISSDIAEAARISAVHNISNESNTIAYMNFDIINRYRVMNAQLEEILRRLIVYASLLKDKV